MILTFEEINTIRYLPISYQIIFYEHIELSSIILNHDYQIHIKAST